MRRLLALVPLLWISLMAPVVSEEPPSPEFRIYALDGTEVPVTTLLFQTAVGVVLGPNDPLLEPGRIDQLNSLKASLVDSCLELLVFSPDPLDDLRRRSAELPLAFELYRYDDDPVNCWLSWIWANQGSIPGEPPDCVGWSFADHPLPPFPLVFRTEHVSWALPSIDLIPGTPGQLPSAAEIVESGSSWLRCPDCNDPLHPPEVAPVQVTIEDPTVETKFDFDGSIFTVRPEQLHPGGWVRIVPCSRMPQVASVGHPWRVEAHGVLPGKQLQLVVEHRFADLPHTLGDIDLMNYRCRGGGGCWPGYSWVKVRDGKLEASFIATSGTIFLIGDLREPSA